MALSPLTRRSPPILPLSLGVLILALVPGAVWAQSIRVLLAQDVAQVEVRSEAAVVLAPKDGPIRVVQPPITISSAATGFMVNGRKVPGRQLEIRPTRFGLSVSFLNEVPAGRRHARGATRAGLSTGERGGTMAVSGMVRLLRKGKGLATINLVELEEYVKGVVPSEVNASWHPEMLKVQAVAARTYALYNKMLSVVREYDLVATTQDQVYRGRFGVDARVEQAVEQTKGIVVTHHNAPIYAAFSSTAAGPTEDAINVWAKDLPYLKGVECPFDLSSPYYQWRASVKLTELEQHLRRQGVAVGTIATITPVAYSRAGRVTKLRILHSRGESLVRGEDLRKAVGYTVLPSTQFEVESLGRTVVFVGYGAGHAVGLCQWGAKELAELGYPYPSILQYYYPGTELRNAAASALDRPPKPAP